MQSEKKCQVCQSLDACFLCSRCKAARYCSATCQVQDWGVHKKQCSPILSKKDRLGADVVKWYDEWRTNAESHLFRRYNSFYNSITEVLNRVVPKWMKTQSVRTEMRIVRYGSAASDLRIPSSDMDIGIHIAGLRKALRRALLAFIVRPLQSTTFENRCLSVELILSARVPLIKIESDNLSADVCILHDCTQLAINSLWSQIVRSKPVKISLTAIKYWAAQRRINCARHQYMNSIAYLLLATHFMQQRKVLPLFDLAQSKDRFIVRRDKTTLLPEASLNVGEIVTEFFLFYQQLLESSQVAPIISISGTLRHSSSQCIWFIADPCDPHRSVAKSLTIDTFNDIRAEFARVSSIMNAPDASNLWNTIVEHRNVSDVRPAKTFVRQRKSTFVFAVVPQTPPSSDDEEKKD